MFKKLMLLAMFLVMLVYFLFASVYTVAKLNLNFASPIFIVGSRFFAAGAIMMAYIYLFRGTEFRMPKKLLWKVFLLGLFNIYLTNIFAFIALQDLDSFRSCFTYSLSPFISAIFSYFLFAETFSSRKLLGLLMGFLGFFSMILYEHLNQESAINVFLSPSWSNGIMLLSVVCSVYGWIILKQLVHNEGMTALMANGWGMLIGGLMALVHSFVIEDWSPIPVSHPILFFECFLYLILVSNLICYNLYGYLLKTYSATLMSFAGFLTPLFTAFFGWLFLNEVVTWPFLLSFVIVFLGLFLFYQEELQSSTIVALKEI